MATPPPIDLIEQLLPWSYRSALFQLRSGYCSRLQSYHHSVGWADDPTAPAVTSPTTRWPISLAAPHIPRTWPPEICGWHHSRLLNSWQGSHSSAICPHCRSTFTPFLPNPHSCCWPPPLGPPVGPHHLHLTLHTISFHSWSGCSTTTTSASTRRRGDNNNISLHEMHWGMLGFWPLTG